MLRRSVLGLLIAAALAAVLGASGARAWGTRSVFVDDDKAQCHSAQFTTIQAAVAASAPGTRITVCPGVYSATTIDKPGISLTGATARATSRCLDRTAGTNPTVDSIVNGGAGTPAFRVTASGVSIVGFTVQGAVAAAGIDVAGTVSGTTLAKNIVQLNAPGIALNGNGTHLTTAVANCVRDNNVAGPGSGDGIASDRGLKKALVLGNLFTGQFDAGIIVNGNAGTQAFVGILGNQSVDDAPIVVANLTDSAIAGNRSLRSDATGIFVGGGSTRLAVFANVLRDCVFAGINVRFAPELFPVTTNNTKLAITRNRVVGCGAGIRLRNGATQNLVRENSVQGSVASAVAPGDGITLESSSQNFVSSNSSTGNGRDGLRADATSAGNQILGNTMTSNVEHDCHDDSGGSGTAGTANVWSGDVGATQNRPGLCRAPSTPGGSAAAPAPTAGSAQARHSRHGE